MNVIHSKNNGIENPTTVVTEVVIDKGMPPLPRSIGKQQFISKRQSIGAFQSSFSKSNSPSHRDSLSPPREKEFSIKRESIRGPPPVLFLEHKPPHRQASLQRSHLPPMQPQVYHHQSSNRQPNQIAANAISLQEDMIQMTDQFRSKGTKKVKTKVIKRPKKKKRVKPVKKAKKNKQKGIVLQDCLCVATGSQALLEGDIVDIEKFIKNLNVYQCRLHEKVGLYKAEFIKVIKRRSSSTARRSSSRGSRVSLRKNTPHHPALAKDYYKVDAKVNVSNIDVMSPLHQERKRSMSHNGESLFEDDASDTPPAKPVVRQYTHKERKSSSKRSNIPVEPEREHSLEEERSLRSMKMRKRRSGAQESAVSSQGMFSEYF